MIFKIFKKLKEKKKARQEEQSKLMEENKAFAGERVARRRAEMLNKKCPVRNWEKCTEYCVHFREGDISFWPGFEGTYGEWVPWFPKCKLWGKQ